MEKAIEVTNVPHQDSMVTPSVEKKDNVTITTFVKSEFFTVYKWDVPGKAAFSFDFQYLLLSVIEGEGSLVHNGESYEVKKGHHLIIPVGFGEFELNGQCELIVSHT